MGHLTYLACSFAKPLWALIEELTPGKRLASNDSKRMSASVARASLHTHWKKIVSLLLKLCLGLHWHSRRIGSLMSDDDSRLRWGEANIPFMANGRSSLIWLPEDSNCVTPTVLHRSTVASWCYWDEIPVRSAMCCCSHNNTIIWSPFQFHTEKKENKRRTTRPIGCYTWVTIRGAGEERVRFERRDLRWIERSDAPLLREELKKARCSAENRGQQI